MSGESQPRVFVARELPEPARATVLSGADAEIWADQMPPPREVLLDKAVGRQGLLTLLTDRVDAELLDRAGDQLVVVSNFAIGVDNVDLAEATARGVLVCNTPDVLTETTADLTFALILAAARRLLEGVELIRRGEWVTWEPQLLLGRDVHGATLGVVGLGRIGAAVARRGRAFGMEILYVGPSAKPELERDLGAQRVELDELLERADVVTIHAPLTDETHHLIDAAALSRMKHGAVLVNTARGPLVHTEALVEALEAGRVVAGLDVTDPEPLPADHPLAHLPGCLVVPHIGSASRSTRAQMASMAVDNLLCALRGERPAHLVNPEVLGSQRRSHSTSG